MESTKGRRESGGSKPSTACYRCACAMVPLQPERAVLISTVCHRTGWDEPFLPVCLPSSPSRTHNFSSEDAWLGTRVSLSASLPFFNRFFSTLKNNRFFSVLRGPVFLPCSTHITFTTATHDLVATYNLENA